MFNLKFSDNFEKLFKYTKTESVFFLNSKMQMMLKFQEKKKECAKFVFLKSIFFTKNKREKIITAKTICAF